MQFNRKLFKEAFKRGYKAAKRVLNEKKIESFEKQLKGPAWLTRDNANYYSRDNFSGTTGIKDALERLNDERSLINYVKRYNRFMSLMEYISATYKRGEKPKAQDIKEVYKTYRAASADLNDLYNIIRNTKYEDSEAKKNALDAINRDYAELKQKFNKEFAEQYGDLRIGDLDPKHWDDYKNSITGRQQRSTLKRLHNQGKTNVDPNYR